MKQNFFVDMDCTVLDSVKAFCDVYNLLYQDHPDFVPANPTGINPYDLYIVCPLLDASARQADSIFGCAEFFEKVQFMTENTFECLKAISMQYKIIPCSVGVPSNLAHKHLWIEKNLPFVEDTMMLGQKFCKMDKSVVNMKDAWFLDDVASNLLSSNAKFKSCYGDYNTSNVTWQSKRCFDWNEVCEWMDVTL